MAWWKVLAGIVVLALLAAGAGYYRITSDALKLPIAELETKYKLPNSQFADIDGIRVHYVEDGAKELPALVLIHASYMNLRTWDQMAKALSDRFHVVRLDLLTAGLTGPDPKNDYSTERHLMMVDELTRRLGVEKFALLGTSSGGTVAYRYAAAHPDRVTRLILINSAGMPRTATTDPNRPRGTSLSRWIESHHKSKDYWRNNLYINFTAVPPSEDLIQMVYDMNRRLGLEREALLYLRNYHNGGPEETLAKITAPTLIMWGMSNPTVMHLEANVFELWLTGAPSLVKKYPHMGHYFYLESPDQVHQDVAAFLNGEMDADLRQTQRVPVNVAAFGAK
jgi:pimeloyl-ACP methyl ester carboxylesterase